jgi:hypothetical protein
VLISSAFYERHILPKQTFTNASFWENVFRPRIVQGVQGPGAMRIIAETLIDTGSVTDLEGGGDVTIGSPGTLIQVALHHLLFHVEAKDIREPIEARWKAFRDRQASVSSAKSSVPTTVAAKAPATPAGPALVYGAWSWKLSPWRASLYVVPLAGILAIVTNQLGIWDTPGLRAAREERMEKAQKMEADRQERERIREELSKSVKIGR